jgi:hypothetical protein
MGVQIAMELLGIKRRQRFKAPFDLVTKTNGYEVKTLSADSKDNKIHVADKSYLRKLNYATVKKIKPILLAVVVSETKIRVCKSDLKQSVRIHQMRTVKVIKVGGEL